MASRKRAAGTDAEVKAAVDELLGEFGVVAEADTHTDLPAPAALPTGERSDPLPSGEVDALWGARGRKKK